MAEVLHEFMVEAESTQPITERSICITSFSTNGRTFPLIIMALLYTLVDTPEKDPDEILLACYLVHIGTAYGAT